MEAPDDTRIPARVELPSLLMNRPPLNGCGWLRIPQMEVLDKGIQPGAIGHKQLLSLGWQGLGRCLALDWAFVGILRDSLSPPAAPC